MSIVLQLQRRHTMAESVGEAHELPFSRSNSSSTMAKNVVITESELSSSWLYKNKKAEQMNNNEIFDTSESSAQITSNKNDGKKQRFLRPNVKSCSTSAENKKNSCCFYVLVALVIILASLSILSAIGSVLYVQLFSTYNTKPEDANRSEVSYSENVLIDGNEIKFDKSYVTRNSLFGENVPVTSEKVNNENSNSTEKSTEANNIGNTTYEKYSTITDSSINTFNDKNNLKDYNEREKNKAIEPKLLNEGEAEAKLKNEVNLKSSSAIDLHPINFVLSQGVKLFELYNNIHRNDSTPLINKNENQILELNFNNFSTSDTTKSPEQKNLEERSGVWADDSGSLSKVVNNVGTLPEDRDNKSVVSINNSLDLEHFPETETNLKNKEENLSKSKENETENYLQNTKEFATETTIEPAADLKKFRPLDTLVPKGEISRSSNLFRIFSIPGLESSTSEENLNSDLSEELDWSRSNNDTKIREVPIKSSVNLENLSETETKIKSEENSLSKFKENETKNNLQNTKEEFSTESTIEHSADLREFRPLDFSVPNGEISQISNLFRTFNMAGFESNTSEENLNNSDLSEEIDWNRPVLETKIVPPPIDLMRKLRRNDAGVDPSKVDTSAFADQDRQFSLAKAMERLRLLDRADNIPTARAAKPTPKLIISSKQETGKERNLYLQKLRNLFFERALQL